MKYTEKHPRRLAALLLALVMLLTTFTVPAYAQEDWELLSIRLSWTDANGAPYEAYAMPVSWSGDQSYWVQVSADAPLTALTMNVSHPNHAYTFDPADGSTLMNVVDSGLAMDATNVIPIAAYEDGNYVTTFNLYVSTQIMPEQPAPQPAEADVQIIYRAADGSFEETETVHMVQGGDNTVSPRAYDGYTVDQQSVYVDVTESGANPNPVVFTYARDVYSGTVNVICVDDKGNQLYSEQKTLSTGDDPTIVAPKFDGYNIDGADSVTITLGPDGATPNEVTFYYVSTAPQPAEADVQIIYRAADGSFEETEMKHLVQGEENNTISARTYDGYTPDQESVYVDVTESGANPNPVVFTYARDVYSGTVNVICVDDKGNQLYSEQKTLSTGDDPTIVAPKFDGYNIDGADSVTITLGPDGATPNEVTFYYVSTVPQPAEADVQIIYRAADGSFEETEMKHLVQGGDNTVVARTTYEGYTPDQESVYVDVTADGASPNPVVFTYTRNAPTEIAIAVEYYNETTGEVMATDSQNVPVNQTTPISPKPELLANYDVEATNAQPVDVTVDAQGNADKPTVRFTYKNREVAPVPDAVITVYYIDLDDGGAAFNQETKNCPAGQPTTIAPNEALTAGYVAENADPVTVNVDANGVADRTEVTFSYRKEKPAATSATIEINYEDEEGHDVASFQTKELSNSDTPYTISAEPTDLTAGYELISAPTVEVWVKDGVADPAVVRFVYEKKQQEPTPTPEPEPEPEPVYADVTVQYVDQQGQQVAAAQVHQGLGQGDHDITAAPEGLPEGYTLVDDEATKQVTVFADGSVSMNPVIFVYAAPQPAATPQKAIVTTYYRNEAGENIADPVEVELTQLGMTTAVAPDRARVPAEYDANSAAPVPVEVSELGVPTPGEVVFTFAKAEPVDVPIPQGEMINRFGTITEKQTAVRPRPIADKNLAKEVARLAKGTNVYVLREELNEKGESWMRVLYNDGQYFISSQCIKVLSQKESDELMAQYETPITPWTEDQLPAPGTVAGDEPAPTETPTPTEAPTPTAIPDQYAGYALTEGKTALRSAMSMEDNAIQSTLDDLQLVMVSRQEYQEGSSAAWSVVTTLDNQSGYVPDANLRRISDKEAQIYIDKWNSEHATAAPTDVPTATPTPAPYTGYALTNGAVALRTEISSADSTIIRRMEANELVMVTRQSYEQGTNALWSQVTTLDNMPGYVPDGSLKHINNEEAQYYLNLWNQQNATPTPSATPEPTATPNTVSGYAYTVGDDVYFRSLASTMSSIIDVLPRNVVVYVRAQEYVDGVAWHVVQYNKQWGYIRADMLRMMTIDEENAYLNSLSSPEPTLAITPQPYNPDSLSSYGYVSASSVNFRKEASTSSSKLGTLKQYAFCLILGTTENNGSTWYHVNYGGKVGYISGEYFKQMTITELEKFLDSNEYRQGISNNTSSGNTDNTGNTKPNSGGIVSAEDQTVSVWTNPNSGLNVSYEPFDPFATVAPVATGSAQPTATTTIEPLPSESLEPLPSAEVTYPMEETESGSSIVGWIIGIAVVALLGGGVYAYVIYTQNKRKTAQRAAQRRAQAAAQQRGEGRPYARQNGVPGQPGQPRTGTYPNQNGQAQRPGMQGPTAQRSGAQAPTAQRPVNGGQPTAQRPVNGGQPTAQQPRRPYGASATPQNPYSRPATPGNGQATGASEASNAYNRPAGQPSDYGAAFRPQNGGAGGTTPPTQGSTPANGAAPMGRRSAYRASHNAANGQNGTGRPNDNGDFAEDKDNGDF